jgi:hypothetical protein
MNEQATGKTTLIEIVYISYIEEKLCFALDEIHNR